MATAAQVLPATRRRSRQTLTAGRAPVREVYFVKRIDNSRVVREVDQSRHRECYALAGLIGLAFLLCFAYAWQHFQSVSYDYQIGQLRQRQISLEKWNRELKAEEQRLDNSAFIDGKAQSELGLRPADPARVVNADQLPDGQSSLTETQLAESRPIPSAAMAGLRRTR
jgi:hypothetical protein